MPNELPNYIEDDWNDNNLSGRSSADKGVYYAYSDGGTGDLLKGVYRPVWEILAGAPYASGGVLVSNDDSGSDAIATPSKWTTGSFRYDFTWVGTIDSAWNPSILAQDTTTNNGRCKNCYFDYYTDTSPSVRFYKNEGGSATQLISGDWQVDKNPHTSEITRDSYGNFEKLHDGSSIGTTTDTTYTSSNYIHFGGGKKMGEINIDNLQVS